MKIFLSLITTLILLSACSSTDTQSDSKKVNSLVPASCEIPEVIAEFAAQVPGSKYVPTNWEAFPDTDLAAVLDNDGIACTYGIQVAEVGGTVLWTPNAENVWEQRKYSWIEFGETPIDLPGINETAAYVLREGTKSGEMHVWKINLLIDGMWIQISASFLQNIAEALPIIKAAIAASN